MARRRKLTFDRGGVGERTVRPKTALSGQQHKRAHLEASDQSREAVTLMIKKHLWVVAALTSALALVIEGSATAEASGSDAKRKPRSQRVVELPYEFGSGGLVEANNTWWCVGMSAPVPRSCVDFPTGSKDRFVNLEITDSSGLPVPAVVEIEDPLQPFKEPICGGTAGPIEVRPGLAVLVWINVRSVTVPCPGTGTTGVVTAVFSKHS